MTPLSKHIFIQVNTEAIIALNAEYKGNIPTEAVLGQTILYDQGSMAIGSPIKDMYIDVEEGQEIYIVILPLQLYGYNKVYFTGFVDESGSKIINQLSDFNNHILSCQVSIYDYAEIGAEEHFGLKVVIEEYSGDGNPPQFIDIIIDPVLRVIQRRHS